MRTQTVSCNKPVLLAIALALAGHAASGATLSVGPGKTYAAPCAAFDTAADGDTITIDAAGDYAGNVCAIRANGLTIRGVGGRAKIDAAGKHAEGKAIWVIKGKNTTIENIEFCGAKVPDRNGAGIRQEGAGLTIRNCYFHDNEDGILGGAGAVTIEYTEFARNGFGDGYSHNMYISGNTTVFTLRGCYSHHAKVGHNVKSRAQTNYILYNRIMDEADGTSSYAVDLPDGGTSYLIGNLLQQGLKTENSTIFSFAAESRKNATTGLYVINNTFVNDRGSGVFIGNRSPVPASLVNNLFVGNGTMINGPVQPATNLQVTDAKLMDRARFDYRPAPGSPAIDKGSDPGKAGSFGLEPVAQYVHPCATEPRRASGAAIDIGAYECR